MRIVGRRLGKASEATEAVTEGVSLPSSLLEVEDRFKDFAREQGLPPFSLPSEELMNRCRRPDLLRLAKSWGGMQGLSELLGYSVRLLCTGVFPRLGSSDVEPTETVAVGNGPLCDYSWKKEAQNIASC